MKKTLIITLIGILVIAVTVTVIIYNSNPLRKSEEKIRESILEVTPIGTSMEDVINIAKNNEEWSMFLAHDDWGVVYDNYVDRPVDPANYNANRPDRFYIIGEKSVFVCLGGYPTLLNEYLVCAWWAFDENENLIDIIIGKEGAI